MKRKHTPQFLNQPWVPEFLMNLVREFITWFAEQVNATKPFIPVIEEGLTHVSNRTILNIEHSIGAGIETLKPYLDSDILIKSIGRDISQDVSQGLYLSINGFHQLRREEASDLLKKALASKNPIAIVEGNNDSLLQVVGMSIIVPLTVMLTTPFVTPFRLSRILFTYIIPILPFIILIDGCMALFKLYAPADLEELVKPLQTSTYQWRSGKMDNGRGGKIIYLLGFPTY